MYHYLLSLISFAICTTLIASIPTPSNIFIENPLPQITSQDRPLWESLKNYNPPKEKQIVIIIPSYNEEKNIKNVLKNLFLFFFY
jgi:cellulose synthase/poly-beta-1,6-N-acetylglucosamine synthase-like glycosyltransferase